MRKKVYDRRIPNPAELDEIYGELFKKPNVQFCYVGRKTKGDKSTRLTSIVCGVKAKIKKKDLGHKDLIPPQFFWLKHASRPRQIPTDVIEMPLKFHFRKDSIIGPGDKVIRKGGGSASVGIAMQHPRYGAVVTTAAHLFEPGCEGEEVEVESAGIRIKGKLRKRVRNQEADYAIIQVVDPCLIQNLFRDRYAVGPPYFVKEDDIWKELRVLPPGTDPSIKVRCQGIHGSFHEPGGPSMSGLILTEDKTQTGHSGSCLIDDAGAVWGLLVGGTCDGGKSFSAFMPAYIPLARERAQLI